MKKFFTRAAVAAIAVAGIAGAVSTPTAGAVSTDQYDRVRYVMCGNDDVTIDMQNVWQFRAVHQESVGQQVRLLRLHRVRRIRWVRRGQRRRRERRPGIVQDLRERPGRVKVQ